MGLALAIALKIHGSLVKGLKLKVRKFWWLVPTFRRSYRGKLVRDAFLLLPLRIG